MKEKVCSKCKTKKPIESFSSCKRDGIISKCRSCVKEYNKAYNIRNKDVILKNKKEYYMKNSSKILEQKKIYNIENRANRNAIGAKRRATKLNATPKWLTWFDIELIRNMYRQGKDKSMHVDHIVPLQGKNVCGLHVPWNLQLLSPEDNMRKGNKYE